MHFSQDSNLTLFGFNQNDNIFKQIQIHFKKPSSFVFFLQTFIFAFSKKDVNIWDYNQVAFQAAFFLRQLNEMWKGFFFFFVWLVGF